MKFFLFIVFVCFIGIFVIKCTQETNEMNNADLIFHNSYQLKVDPYSYIGADNVKYLCQGDTIYYTAIPDTFDSQPLIKWDSIKLNVISVSIFTSPVSVADNKIKNSNEIIWQWNSGMKFDKISSIKYLEGKNVLNNIVDYDHLPNPLKPGIYYWAVWGWNSEGTRILYSSRQMSFYVQ
jgi:hypothetical protein